MYKNENQSENTEITDNYFKKDSTFDKKKNYLKKEPGLNNLVQAEGRVKALNSNMMANTYLNTYNSLKDHYNEVKETNPVLAEKIQRDLSDFYKSVGNRFNTTIRSEGDFEELINNVRSLDDTKREIKNNATINNEGALEKINELKEKNSSVSQQLNKMMERRDEIDDNLKRMAETSLDKDAPLALEGSQGKQQLDAGE